MTTIRRTMFSGDDDNSYRQQQFQQHEQEQNQQQQQQEQSHRRQLVAWPHHYFGNNEFDKYDNKNNTNSSSNVVTGDRNANSTHLDTAFCSKDIFDCGPFGTCITDCTNESIDNNETNTKDTITNDFKDDGTLSLSSCKNYKCRCDDGYTGPACSVPVTKCNGYILSLLPSLQTNECYNGGTCQRIEQKLYNNITNEIITTTTTDDNSNNENNNFIQLYECNCQNATSIVERNNTKGTDPYIGMTYQCQYTKQVSCDATNEISNLAYCLNGGYCRSKIHSSSRSSSSTSSSTSYQHYLKRPIPCHCPDTLYGGRHCQYPIDNIPIAEQQYVNETLDWFYETYLNTTLPPLPSNNNDMTTIESTSRMPGYVIFFYFIVLTSMGIFVYYIVLKRYYRHYKKQQARTSSTPKSRAASNALRDGHEMDDDDYIFNDQIDNEFNNNNNSTTTGYPPNPRSITGMTTTTTTPNKLKTNQKIQTIKHKQQSFQAVPTTGTNNNNTETTMLSSSPTTLTMIETQDYDDDNNNYNNNNHTSYKDDDNNDDDHELI